MSDSSYDASQVIDAVQSGGLVFDASVISWPVTRTGGPVLAYNASRKALLIHNVGDDVYIKIGLGVSDTSYSFILRSSKFIYLSGWGGPVSCKTVNSISTCRVTEIF